MECQKNLWHLEISIYNSGIFIHAPRNTKLAEPIRLEYKLDKENPSGYR